MNSAENTNSMEAAQKNGRASSTSAHNARKKIKWNLIKVAVGVAILLILLFSFRGCQTEREAQTQSESNTPARTGQLVELKPEAGSSFPIGEWSKSYQIPIGYTVILDAGNCVVYKVRYQLYGRGWAEHKCDGSNTPGNEIQFQALEPGLTKIPFVIER